MQNQDNQKFCSVLVDGENELTPLKINYTGEMNGGILTLQIHQLYRNDKGEENSPDSTAILALPKNRSHCITGIDCLLNDQKVDLKIEEEKIAEEIAKEGEKQGRSTIRSVTTPDDQYLNIHLGSISHGSNIDITIRMEITSTNHDSNTYQTVIPFSDSCQNTDDFTFSIVFNEIAPIEDVEVTSSYERSTFEYTFDGSILTIEGKPIGTIVILTKMTEEIQSTIQNDKNDEYSIITVIPHFLSEKINSDFIFVVDCSGSMSGSRIRNASECLSIFLHSLPIGCKFNIIKFGTMHSSIFSTEGGLVDYNEENLKTAEKAIKNLKADMGGTNLLGPLSEAYDQIELNSKKGNVVSIFLLTDGEIHDTETVFKLVNKNRSKSRIFSIGIGKDADRNLVSGLALSSFGKFDFVSESSQITDKVVNLLTLSLAPAMTNVSIHASAAEGNENDFDSLEIVPNPLTPIYDGNLTTIYVKRNSNLKPIENVLITGNIGDEEAEIVVGETVNCCEFSAKKLFAFNAINDYEKLYDNLREKGQKYSPKRRWFHNGDDDDDDKDNEDKEKLEKLKNQIVQLSIENGILSKFTSYVGVENKPHHEMKNEDGNLSDQANSMFRPQMQAMAYGAPPMMNQMNCNMDMFRCAPPCVPPNEMLYDVLDDESAPLEEERSKNAYHKRSREKASYEKSARNEEMFYATIGAAPERHKREMKEESFVPIKAPPPQRQMMFNKQMAQMAAPKVQNIAAAAPSKMFHEPIKQMAGPPQMMTNEAPPVQNMAAPPTYEMFNRANLSNDRMMLFSLNESGPSHSFQQQNSINQSNNQTFCGEPPINSMNRLPKEEKIENSMLGIISSQDFDGKWKSAILSQLDGILFQSESKGKAALNDFVSALNIENEDGCIKSTIVALCILYKFYSKEHSRWKIIEAKAIRWLNSKVKKQWANDIQKLILNF